MGITPSGSGSVPVASSSSTSVASRRVVPGTVSSTDYAKLLKEFESWAKANPDGFNALMSYGGDLSQVPKPLQGALQDKAFVQYLEQQSSLNFGQYHDPASFDKAYLSERAQAIYEKADAKGKGTLAKYQLVLDASYVQLMHLESVKNAKERFANWVTTEEGKAWKAEKDKVVMHNAKPGVEKQELPIPSILANIIQMEHGWNLNSTQAEKFVEDVTSERLSIADLNKQMANVQFAQSMFQMFVMLKAEYWQYNNKVNKDSIKLASVGGAEY